MADIAYKMCLASPDWGSVKCTFSRLILGKGIGLIYCLLLLVTSRIIGVGNDQPRDADGEVKGKWIIVELTIHLGSWGMRQRSAMWNARLTYLRSCPETETYEAMKRQNRTSLGSKTIMGRGIFPRTEEEYEQLWPKRARRTEVSAWFSKSVVFSDGKIELHVLPSNIIS